MLWIMNRKEPIPKEFEYDGWRTDKTKYGSTPLMLWVKYRKDPIPEDMKFDGW